MTVRTEDTQHMGIPLAVIEKYRKLRMMRKRGGSANERQMAERAMARIERRWPDVADALDDLIARAARQQEDRIRAAEAVREVHRARAEGTIPRLTVPQWCALYRAQLDAQQPGSDAPWWKRIAYNWGRAWIDVALDFLEEQVLEREDDDLSNLEDDLEDVLNSDAMVELYEDRDADEVELQITMPLRLWKALTRNEGFGDRFVRWIDALDSDDEQEERLLS